MNQPYWTHDKLHGKFFEKYSVAKNIYYFMGKKIKNVLLVRDELKN